MKIKKEKGITLITLTVAVTILIIISSMLIYNSTSSIKMRDLKMMQNDIEILDDKIDAYYIKYGALPIQILYTGAINFEPQANDSDEYYVIDLSAIEGITLNYGLDFANITSSEDTKNYTDVYIINKQSHHIYYPKGIEFEGEMYYTTDGQDDEISIVDIPTEDILAGKKYDDETDITVGETPVTIPGGVTISGIDGEYENVDDGLVIYIIPEGEEVTDWEADSDENGIIDVQETYDQFVWVPVPNAIAVDSNEDGTIDATDIDDMIGNGQYPMAISTGTTTDTDGNTITNYRGILYEFTLTNGKVVATDLDWSSTSTSYREPAYLTSSGYADASGYNTVGITQALLQTEFNTMIEKVASNKGFWAGRYETSNMIGTATTSFENTINKATVEADTTNKIAVIKGTTTGVSYNSTVPNCINWYRMYAQQKNYSNLSNITSTSSMIWGSQWDQIMIWMKDVKNDKNTVTTDSYYVINAVGMANYGLNPDGTTKTTALEPTGNSENYKVKNIYDLAGNLYDWTLEANTTERRVVRGLSYELADASTARTDSRIGSLPFNAYSNYGSRSTLY